LNGFELDIEAKRFISVKVANFAYIELRNFIHNMAMPMNAT
jgi:hypothetical protein